MKKWFIIMVISCLFINYSCKDDSDIITVGAIFPMSGDWGNYGVQMSNGLKLWETNNENSKIKIVYADGKGNVNTSLSVYNKLVQINHMDICISGVSSVLLGIAPLSEKNDVFTINAGATNPEIKTSSNNIFCIIPDANVEASYIADFLIDSIKRFSCFVYWKNDDSGRGMLNSFRERYEQIGGRIIDNEPIENAGFVKNTLSRIKKLNIKTVFIPTNGEMIAKIIRQAYNMGMNDILWVGYAAAESPELIQELKNLDNIKFIFSSYSYKNSSNTSLTTKFKQDYIQMFGEEPQYYSATCYDAISLISKAVANNCKTSEEIKQYIYSLDSYEGVSGLLNIGGKNYVTSGMVFCMYNEGQIIPINSDLYKE